MKKNNHIYYSVLAFILSSLVWAQNAENDTIFKKRVLETTEIDFLTSFYSQDGENAAVTGGVGTEELTDFTPTIVVSIPLNDDDVLTIDGEISAYTSASSSNLNPFDSSGSGNPKGSPWVESSGASRSDVWASANVSYSHSSDDRNRIWNANAGFSSEFDYSSLGLGAGYTMLFNEKNTEVSLSGKVFLDKWNPKTPIELDSYLGAGGNLNTGFFSGVDILDQNGNTIDKNSSDAWNPLHNELVTDKKRNTYSASLSWSQILSKNFQASLFLDVVIQNGWLSNPMQRVYFSDKNNFYVGEASSIPNYTSSSNKDVFHLADDIERLPDSRFKLPIGLRANYYVNEWLSLRTYYRYYYDDWGVNSHTAQLEIPVKIGNKFTVYPSYRYYTQTAVDYFAPYNQLLSTEQYYTSDYDLSDFDANQFGFGVRYMDVLSDFSIWCLGVKSIDLNYAHYDRSTGLTADIVSLSVKFLLNKK